MRMPEASDKGSQPYSYPFRGCEMAGARVAPIISACPWVGDMSSVCPLPKGKVSVWVSLFPAISQPLWGQLYGWLPLSNAYGIPFRCNTIHNQTTTAFSFAAAKHIIKQPTAFLSAATQYIIKQPTAFSFAAANISTVNFYLITTFLSFSINMPLLGLA